MLKSNVKKNKSELHNFFNISSLKRSLNNVRDFMVEIQIYFIMLLLPEKMKLILICKTEKQ